MSNEGSRTIRRLHQVFEAVGTAVLTPLMGAKRAGQENNVTHRVATGGMIVTAVVSAGLAALGAAAGGVAAPAVVGLAMGAAFLGAFLGILAGLVLRVNVSPESSRTSMPEEAEEKKNTKS